MALLPEAAWRLVFTLAALLLVAVDAGRGRGSPTTTTPAPPLLPGPLDLTLPLDHNVTFWPDDVAFSVTLNMSSQSDHGWLSSLATCSGGQVGTHIQAPYHLNEHGWTVDQLPLDRLLVPAVILDVSSDAAQNASFELTAEHLVAWEKLHGQPPPNYALLVNFGWGPRLNIAPNETAPSFPGLSKSFADHLVQSGRAVGVGVDVPAVDPGRVKGQPAARALLNANMYALLNLDLSHDIPVKGFSLLVSPTKVRGAGVAAARVFATARSPFHSAAERLAAPGLALLGALVWMVAGRQEL